MNEQEIEMGERFLVDRVAFFLGKEDNWSPRVDVSIYGPGYAILRLDEFSLYLFKESKYPNVKPQVLSLLSSLRKPVKEKGRLASLDYVLADESCVSK